MAWFIQDYDETQIFISDSWGREYYITKFNINKDFPINSEDEVLIQWSEFEKGDGGQKRELKIYFEDVVDGYGGYLSNPSSAEQLREVLLSYIPSAWQNLQDQINDLPDLGLTVGARLKYNVLTESIYVNLDPITETASFTLDETYDGHLVRLDNAVELAVTVPAEPHDVEVGAEILFMAETDGALYFLEDTGVHIHAKDHLLGLDGHGAMANLIYLGSDEWVLRGDLTTALDADALLFINSVATLNDAQKTAINEYVIALKAANIWTKYIAIYPFIGGTAAAHKWNLKNPVDSDAAFRMVFTGSPTHDANGVTMNGTTQWGDTKIVPNTHMTANDTHISIYSRTSATTTGYDAGVADGANQWLLVKREAAGNFFDDQYAFARRSSTANADGKGDYMGVRSSSTVHKKYKNGVQSGSTETGVASGFSNLINSIMLGAIKLNGAPTGPVAANYAGMTVGAALDDTQAANDYTAMQALQTALARNV